MKRAFACALAAACLAACGGGGVDMDMPLLRPPKGSIVCEGDGAVTEQCARDAAARRGGKVAWLPHDGMFSVVRTEAHQTVELGDKIVVLSTNPGAPAPGDEAAPVDGLRHVISRSEGLEELLPRVRTT